MIFKDGDVVIIKGFKHHDHTDLIMPSKYIDFDDEVPYAHWDAPVINKTRFIVIDCDIYTDEEFKLVNYETGEKSDIWFKPEEVELAKINWRKRLE